MLPDGVHTFPLTFDHGDGQVTINPAGIETPRGLLLLDVGPDGALDQLRERLGEAGFALDDLATVLVTHHDWDHAGGLAALQDATDVTVLASEHEARAVDGRADTRGPGERYPPGRVDVTFDEGVTFHTDRGPARVVPTPGHTPGHVSVYLPDERVLFAADALTADADGLQGPNEGFTEDMDTALTSADRLAALDIETTHCFHGGTVAAGSARIGAIAAGGK
ncbi:MBL fold metallo-hydrolase [Haloglomus litoreum]|uniref:MBL fold metallo-hydrolase n=1 Tax=Haloglomus litoreum TaxID=3034026 RepID=UPI0023E8C2AC|nr:MBL fold metallo-hydrolase [Haloglomus sp. DT116]